MMNAEARAVINRQRGKSSEYVFTYSKGKPIDRINTKAWRRAREEAGLPQVRVHDLKHTFGRRLRAKGVSRARPGSASIMGLVMSGAMRSIGNAPM